MNAHLMSVLLCSGPSVRNNNYYSAPPLVSPFGGYGYGYGGGGISMFPSFGVPLFYGGGIFNFLIFMVRTCCLMLVCTAHKPRSLMGHPYEVRGSHKQNMLFCFVHPALLTSFCVLPHTSPAANCLMLCQCSCMLDHVCRALCICLSLLGLARTPCRRPSENERCS